MDFISSIVGKIIDYSVGPVGEQFGYLVFYKSSIATLQKKFQRIVEKKVAVQQSVIGAQRNQEVVASEVNTWLTSVEKKIEEIEKFLEEDVKANTKCLNGWCPDLKLRYSLGKKAQKNTQAIVELLDEEGGRYDRVYNPAPPREVRSSSIDQWFKDFESRKSTIQNVLNDLKNDDIDMIALWGMGGVGKTKMAKEIKRIVESDNLFHKVAIAVVSQNPNIIKIQGELAESLGTGLKAKFLHGRANELSSILTENKKVLLILDDVWKPLDIEDIGVYRAIKEKSCKILLTTRNEETCNGMSVQPKIFPVELLSEEEALNLFIEMAGNYINASDLISIAKQVAKECARLPLAIAVVGSALRTKRDKNEWKAVLQQLKMSMPQNIFDLQAKVYSSIGFSYNYLESNEAKSCFLLCCLYPEDYDVPVEDLVRYGVAKRLFNGLDTVEETRVQVHAIIKDLRSSNLLLDSNKDECAKMHDVVRDVAISIASKEKNGFMVKLDKGLKDWPPTDRSYDSYTAISLLLEEMKGHPAELKCPKLQLLRLSCLNHSKTFPDNFFNGMKELEMLSMKSMKKDRFSSKSLPLSIQILQNLRMLNLQSCGLGDVSAIGTLGNLEILGFPNSEISELPLEIGNLSRLKLLDMKGCVYLQRIAAGVLSGLSRLEELYVGQFKDWECTTTMEGNGEVTNNNASLAELIHYSNQLVVLEISVPSILCLPKDLHFSNSDFRFQINIGDRYPVWRENEYLFENTLRLKVEDAIDLEEHQTIRSLLKKAVVLKLDIAKYSKHILFKKEQKGILSCSLKDLKICRCENLEYLLEATSDSSPPNTFHLLESLELRGLPRLVGIYNSTDSVEITLTKQDQKQNVSDAENQTKMLSLFPQNLIGSLENLQKLTANGCDLLEVIFELEGLNAEESNIFNNLTVLILVYLPKLLHIWKKGPREIKGFNYLRHLRVSGCDSLKYLFTPSIAKLLVKLEVIRVYECKEMEEILAKESGDEENRDVIAFPLVKTLLLTGLQKLECFHTEDNHAFEWPSLDRIEIIRCPKLKMFVSTSTKTPKLKGVHMGRRGFQPMIEPMIEGDINATIQHVIKEKAGFNHPWTYEDF